MRTGTDAYAITAKSYQATSRSRYPFESMFRAKITGMLVIVAGIAASLAHAEITPIIDFTGGQAFGVVQGANATAGFSFSVTTATTISGLGLFDVGSDGLINSHQIGLWSSGGTLLASATVDNSSSVVASTSSLGDWRETGITSLTLDPGSYVIGASFLDVSQNTEDAAVFSATGTTSLSGISYGTTVIGFSDFAFPDFNENGVDAGAFGPMAFTDVQSAPEPGSLGLSLCALGFCGLAFRSRNAKINHSSGNPCSCNDLA
jgi:hypothetical protein